MSFPQTWKLPESGMESDFEKRVEALKKLIPEDLERAIEVWQELHAELRELQSLSACVSSQNVEDVEGMSLSAKAIALEAMLVRASNLLDNHLLKLDGSGLSYPLFQRRFLAEKKMSLEKEEVAGELAVDGYHAWYELYKTAIGKIQVPLSVADIEGVFSLGQIENFLAHPNREVRKEAFLGLTDACKREEALFSQILTHMLGFRLKLYEMRGWKNPSFEGLFNNRIGEKALSSMWQAVAEKASYFQQFLEIKAKAIGVEKLSWYDLEAPFEAKPDEISYDKAAELIIDSFNGISPSLSAFCKKALTSGWIDAENRPKKAAGGFCTQFPKAKESRIFMTYSGTMINILVLAHELGHAYHNELLFERSELEQLYPETLAETASTTCELLLLDQLGSMQDKMQRSCMFFLNMRARYLFEQKLFETCKQGFVTPEALSLMMLEAQKEAYGNSFSEFHPYFWISKVHFYLTDRPCYNFPYTVGYLLSLAVVSKAKKEPKQFDSWFQAFLQDTGRMSVEEIVHKYFKMDAEKVDFWHNALEIACKK